ncbi:winged helix-turn-helix domain-containing protein [Tistrella bauzanensis]
MTRHSGGPVLDFLDIDRDSPTPLYHQIYTELRRGILSGRLAAGTRLPSTRSIAAELGVSRRPLREAFDHLTAEGLLDARQGAGTVVRARADGRLPAAAASAIADDQAMITRLPARGRALIETTGFDTRSTGAFSPPCPRPTSSRARCSPGWRHGTGGWPRPMISARRRLPAMPACGRRWRTICAPPAAWSAPPIRC